MATTPQSLISTTPTYAAPFIEPLGSQLADYTAGLFNQNINLQGLILKLLDKMFFNKQLNNKQLHKVV